jgi:hypothetical protein
MAYVREDPPQSAVGAEEPAAAEGVAADEHAAAAAAAAVPVITFLYKLTSGAADASFGLNVAKVGFRRVDALGLCWMSRVWPSECLGLWAGGCLNVAKVWFWQMSAGSLLVLVLRLLLLLVVLLLGVHCKRDAATLCRAVASSDCLT